MTALSRHLAATSAAVEALREDARLRADETPRYDWRRHARPEQLPPAGDWDVWLLLGGRGSGKTRSAVEWARQQAHDLPGSRGVFVAPTAADLRDVLIEGVSGILACSPPWSSPTYEPSKRKLTWANGTTALLVSADEPERLRGLGFDWGLADEVRAWRRYREAWQNLRLCMRGRVAAIPRLVVATTPRPMPLIGELLQAARDGDSVVVSSSTVWDNSANLSAAFLEGTVAQYRGTSLEAQELRGDYLSELPNALWRRDMIRTGLPGLMAEVLVAVDPALTSEGDETGIVVVGREAGGRGWVLADYSLRGSPAEWAGRVVEACANHGAVGITAEANAGGELIEHTLKTMDAELPPIELIHASKSKAARAEPVAHLYEQGRVRHAAGADLAELEEQYLMLCRDGYGGAGSPDRADSAIHGLGALMVLGVGNTKRPKGTLPSMADARRVRTQSSYGGGLYKSVMRKPPLSHHARQMIQRPQFSDEELMAIEREREASWHPDSRLDLRRKK